MDSRRSIQQYKMSPHNFLQYFPYNRPFFPNFTLSNSYSTKDADDEHLKQAIGGNSWATNADNKSGSSQEKSREMNTHVLNDQLKEIVTIVLVNLPSTSTAEKKLLILEIAKSI
ncbi:hypothetical protein J1N35_017019 [Gossypium stocksii]|uniref:Uncharacterized protein n=1 Tax=Gossypium stocksii TaxID=47602 RepID=A0A9D3VME4_9ROSI|nr:hypothetical protein J1N35_017019 [Gossypium stocksii]